MKVLGESVPTLKLIDCCLRLFVIPLSVASIYLTVTNHQDNIIYGNLEFPNIKGFRYLVCISAISVGYALVAAVFTWVRFLVAKAWLFFISDQVVAYLMITTVAAVGEMVYLLHNGDRDVSWSEACTSYGSFCNKLNLILALNALAFCCFFILAIISAYQVFSLYQPPFMPSQELQANGT